ncbi:hypothetical protein PoB_007478500 [Plakobranchus ocellatus]|uniref:Uncharacterized protein n=1 Tax=Plakobranchus ocellatus TaxID=259542 RepID=A0AAV4DVU7_9GAST|nr:hypothetical protein PoB_007478500 [Plakobranchus ocellatus]
MCDLHPKPTHMSKPGYVVPYVCPAISSQVLVKTLTNFGRLGSGRTKESKRDNSPQQGDHRFSGPLPGQTAGGGARTREPCRSQGELVSHCVTDGNEDGNRVPVLLLGTMEQTKMR